MKLRKNVRTAALSIVLVLAPVAAHALELPYNNPKSYKFGDRQYAYSGISIDENRRGVLVSDFSNCSYDGDHWATVAVFYSSSGEKLGAVRLEAGMKAYIKGCNERRIVQDFTLSLEQAAEAVRVEIYHYDLNLVNDMDVAKRVIEIIKEILDKPVSSQENGVYWG